MTNRFAPALVTLFLPLVGAGTAHAQDTIGFQSPSKNIVCIYFEDNGHKTLRCDIGDMAGAIPPKPRDCELAWGHSFEVEATGKAGRSCAGDTQMGQPVQILAYGKVWQRSGITCDSKESGVTCSNADRHGFTLSRAKQTVF